MTGVLGDCDGTFGGPGPDLGDGAWRISAELRDSRRIGEVPW